MNPLFSVGIFEGTPVENAPISFAFSVHESLGPTLNRGKLKRDSVKLKTALRMSPESGGKWWSIGKSPRHADTVKRRLEVDVFPAVGRKFINTVTAADLRELMLAIET